MKLASLKAGRDGRLVVVSDDLAWCAAPPPMWQTLQSALDNWAHAEPILRGVAESLAHDFVPHSRFHERDADAPLPRAFRTSST
jgi:fumarylacetoacetate (FAA) hydrolase